MALFLYILFPLRVKEYASKRGARDTDDGVRAIYRPLPAAFRLG